MVTLLIQLSDFVDLKTYFSTNQNSCPANGIGSSQSTRESRNLVATEQGQSENVAQILDAVDGAEAT